MGLNAYRNSPENVLDFSVLNKICEERLKLYNIFEDVKLENLEIGSAKWSDYLKLKITQNNLKTFMELLNPQKSTTFMDILSPCPQSPTFKKAQRDDNIAHWLLGLNYCRTEEHQNDYISWELQWFHLLFMNSETEYREWFIEKNNLSCPEVNYLLKLIHSVNISNDLGVNCMQTTIYQAKFYEIPEVLAKRQVYFRYDGDVLFTGDNIIFYVKRKLKKEFSDCLKFQKKVLPNLGFVNFRYFLNGLPMVVPKLTPYSIDGVNLQNIDQIARDHYPLCMRHIHNILKENHHLKYDCRMQYGIFLYHLGLPYDHALQFWQQEFTKKMSIDMYISKYQYLFKHQYGKVGRKREYKASTCNYILENAPNFNQHHGCPFKHWNPETLRHNLEQDRCSSQSILDIEDLVSEGHFQKACTQYLCVTKEVDEEDIDIIESPNTYVKTSMSLGEDILDKIFQFNSLTRD